MLWKFPGGVLRACEGGWLRGGGESGLLGGGEGGLFPHPPPFPLVLGGGQQRPEQHTVSAQGRTVWVLTLRRNSLIQALDGVGGSGPISICDGSRRVKVKSLSAASSRLSATARHLEPPLAQEGFCGASRSRPRFVGVDHVPVVLGQLVVHVFRGMGQEVAVLVNRAALDRQLFAPQGNERGFQARGTIDDHELGSLSGRGVEIVEGTGARRPCSRRPCS